MPAKYKSRPFWRDRMGPWPQGVAPKGGLRVLGPSHLSQRPSDFARSTSARPAACIRPSLVSFATFSRLISDQLLFERRGVKRCRNHCPSALLRCPSIHPKHSATSTASGYVMVGIPELFLAILIQTPGELAWFSVSHCSQALRCLVRDDRKVASRKVACRCHHRALAVEDWAGWRSTRPSPGCAASPAWNADLS